MKTLSHFMVFFILLFVSASCQKEDATSPAIPPIVNGEYIEFRIDGHQYKITGSAAGGTVNADAAAMLFDSGFQKGLVFRFVNMDPLQMVGFTVYDLTFPMGNQYTISADPYQTNPYNPSEFGFIMEDERQYIFSLATTGSFEFTSIDSVVGGIVEGIMQLTNLDLTDENGDVISSGHTLTNGKFRVIIQ